MRLLHLFDHAVTGTKRVTAPITQGARVVKEKTAQKKTAPVPTPLDDELPGLVTRKGYLTPDGPAIDDDMPTVPRVMPTLALPNLTLAKPPKPSEPLAIPELLGNDGTKHEFALPPLELLNEAPPKPVKLEFRRARKTGRADADLE